MRDRLPLFLILAAQPPNVPSILHESLSYYTQRYLNSILRPNSPQKRLMSFELFLGGMMLIFYSELSASWHCWDCITYFSLEELETSWKMYFFSVRLSFLIFLLKISLEFLVTFSLSCGNTLLSAALRFQSADLALMFSQSASQKWTELHPLRELVQFVLGLDKLFCSQSQWAGL